MYIPTIIMTLFPYYGVGHAFMPINKGMDKENIDYMHDGIYVAPEVSK